MASTYQKSRSEIDLETARAAGQQILSLREAAYRGLCSLDGTFGLGAYLPTAWGTQRVTAVRVLADGPWAVVGRGLDSSSYAVTWDTEVIVRPLA